MTYTTPTRAIMLSAEGTAAVTHALERSGYIHFIDPYHTIISAITFFLAFTFMFRVGIPLIIWLIQKPSQLIVKLCELTSLIHKKLMDLFFVYIRLLMKCIASGLRRAATLFDHK